MANFSLNRKCVKLVVTDMNANYQTVVRRMFPNAQVVIDPLSYCPTGDESRSICPKLGTKHCRQTVLESYKILKSTGNFS
ncbi:hypothetical protein EQG49_12240 [Periweissella cryptocerci]|uniref:Transposase IS204/IS1001/IS1096/IS1165 DDE domain-containing protein n=1 Tax=Periweissella cryptocerci TaxID=2506420 RepID=A0A4P6YWM1_9LACO|nr:hypothetical protein EQG49_12240 [Periweissella cryptocerci]